LSTTARPVLHSPADPPQRRHARMAAHATWTTGLAAAVTVGIEGVGFNPTDQGLILAQSWRVLQGEVPHRDIVSARPLGSAYLHTVDHLLPGPLFLTSIMIATLQLVVMTVLLASWTSARPIRSWGVLRTGCVSAATLVNIHLFPVNAWHTIDGLFLIAVGWWALDRGLRADRAAIRRVGLLSLGFASITKQSFVPAVLVGFVVLLVHRRRRGPAASSRWTLAADVVVLGAAPLGYLLLVTAHGGLGDLVAQLTGAAPAAGQRLVLFWDPATPLTWIVLLYAATVALGVASARTVRRPWLRVLTAALGTAVVMGVVVAGGLERAGAWGVALLWMLAVTTAVHGAVHGRVPWRPLGLLLLGYMASLSWGYDSPTLLGGSIAVLTLELLARDVELPPVRLRPLIAAATAVGLVCGTGLWLSAQHAADPYRDRPHEELTAELGTAVPALHGIRTTPSTYRYVQQITDCVERHPATSVAVFPDNPFVYPALGIRNPFPIDWPIPLELVADSRARLDAAADELAARGDFLVLFQTVTDAQLAAGAPVPDHVPPDAPVVDPSGIAEGLRARLGGEPITCGSFVGVWAPG
jgi:hypothetical protein